MIGTWARCILRIYEKVLIFHDFLQFSIRIEFYADFERPLHPMTVKISVHIEDPDPETLLDPTIRGRVQEETHRGRVDSKEVLFLHENLRKVGF